MARTFTASFIWPTWQCCLLDHAVCRCFCLVRGLSCTVEVLRAKRHGKQLRANIVS